MLVSFRKRPSSSDQIEMIKELQQAVKQQAEIINNQTQQQTEQFKQLSAVQALPWYKQLHAGYNMTHSVTTHRPPDLIIAGAKRCGAGPLKMFLNAHPAIKFRYEDAHFFDKGDKKRKRWMYRFMMPMTKARFITAEKTPSYFADPNVPLRIKNTFPEVKILFLLCEPGRRAYSDYKFIRRTRMQTKPEHPHHAQIKLFDSFSNASDYYTDIIQKAFEANTLNELVRGNYRNDSGLEIFTNSLYNVHTEEWLKHFDRSQLLFLDGETLFKNPVSELSRVENFLGIGHQLKEGNFVKDDTSDTFYCIRKAGYVDCTPPNKRLKWNPTETDRVEETIQKLAQFYKKVDLEATGHTLNELLNTTYTWS